MRDPRAAETDFFIHRLAVLGLLLFACVFFAGFIGNEAIAYALTRLDSEKTIAKVTKYESVNQLKIVWYEFSDANNVRYENRVHVPYRASFHPEEGMEVEVTYFPLNPEYSDVTDLLQGRREATSTSLAIGALAVGGAIIVIFFVSARSYRQHKRKMKYY
ncbi:hypothetical protein [Thalassospira lohafexi]|uniref:DUF3592 domain-containing protein n=1 Tax=Thalassospira lohafexi TaxID=744227 RepID=A0A2N3LA07_9PROT|nr:hypothetical protein [Thalassospira lohafexi]PKR59557.1 hypothetical protein COO92_05895 [Thalassospira lohafexi]